MSLPALPPSPSPSPRPSRRTWLGPRGVALGWVLLAACSRGQTFDDGADPLGQSSTSPMGTSVPPEAGPGAGNEPDTNTLCTGVDCQGDDLASDDDALSEQAATEEGASGDTENEVDEPALDDDAADDLASDDVAVDDDSTTDDPALDDDAPSDDSTDDGATQVVDDAATDGTQAGDDVASDDVADEDATSEDGSGSDAGLGDGDATCVMAAEGEACGSGDQACQTCTDQCQFCWIFSCVDGQWMGLEVFPAPCFDCGERRCSQLDQYCLATADAGATDLQCRQTPDGCTEENDCSCFAGATVDSACEP